MCRSFESPSSKGNHLYGQVPFLYFFESSLFWKYLFGNIVQMKYRIKIKNLQEKIISWKQHYKSFINDAFTSNTSWDLIQNNNILRYRKELKKNKSSCTGLPAFNLHCITVSIAIPSIASLSACTKSVQFINSILRYSKF